MDFQLTGLQRRMVDTVRELAQGEFKANAQKYMDGTFPWDNMKKLAEIGVLGMSVPEEYGGLGLPVFDTALLLEEIAKTCYVTAMATLGEAGVQTRVIATYAPTTIRERILAKGRLRRLHPGRLHDRAARRHRRGQLPDQRRHQRRPRHSQRHQDADQPGAGRPACS